MKERIKQIIDYKGITPGELAGLLEVQRSSISHILNGRNKPGAAFLEKFLLVFPEINARWLLTGRGAMLFDNPVSTGNATEAFQEVRSEPPVEYGNTNPHLVDKQKNRSTQVDPERIILLFPDKTFHMYRARE